MCLAFNMALSPEKKRTNDSSPQDCKISLHALKPIPFRAVQDVCVLRKSGTRPDTGDFARVTRMTKLAMTSKGVAQ